MKIISMINQINNLLKISNNYSLNILNKILVKIKKNIIS